METVNLPRLLLAAPASGSGKTTYTEAALYYSGATKRFGKVEDGNTVSDYEAEEIRRKVSVNTSVIPVEWQDTKINFLDTPGYFDRSKAGNECRGYRADYGFCKIRRGSRYGKGMGIYRRNAYAQNDFCQPDG